MKRLVTVSAAALLLTACQTRPERVMARVDGRPIGSNSKLLQQAELDRTICLGETQKSAVGAPPIYTTSLLVAAVANNQKQSALSDVYRGCMAQRGYVELSPEESAARVAAGQIVRSQVTTSR